jgi:hypothetical protein
MSQPQAAPMAGFTAQDKLGQGLSWWRSSK